MAKIKLGARPKTFTKTVKFPMLDGTEGVIEVTYRYRTRSEFGAFIDAIIGDIDDMAVDPVVDPTAPPKKFSMETQQVELAGKSADYIMGAAERWNLDETFTKENVNQLSDELPAATRAIMESYHLACTEGRLGN